MHTQAFKVGDTVRLVEIGDEHNLYPDWFRVGSYGEIVAVYDGTYDVKFKNGAIATTLGEHQIAWVEEED